MLLALWPLFISTTPLPPQQDISGLVAQHVEQKYEKAIAKHVTLHVSTSQKQEIKGFISAKHAPEAAQHKVFAFANTGQRQDVTGSISTHNLVTKVVSSPDTLEHTFKPKIVYVSDTFASTHYQVNAVSTQTQEINGTISVSNSIADAHTNNIVCIQTVTSQTQYIVGKISLSSPISQDNEVSTRLQANAITTQTQEISGKIKTQDIPHVIIKVAETYQYQTLSGSITISNDDDMLMTLLALLDLDDVT